MSKTDFFSDFTLISNMKTTLISRKPFFVFNIISVKKTTSVSAKDLSIVFFLVFNIISLKKKKHYQFLAKTFFSFFIWSLPKTPTITIGCSRCLCAFEPMRPALQNVWTPSLKLNCIYLKTPKK